MAFVTPWSTQLEPGIYRIDIPQRVQVGSDVYVFQRWSDGNLALSRIVTVEGDMYLGFEYILEVVPPPYGFLEVDTTPIKGEVFLNGLFQGVAPQLIALEAGDYAVSFGLIETYLEIPYQLITISAGQTTSIIGRYTSSESPPESGSLICLIPIVTSILLTL